MNNMRLCGLDPFTEPDWDAMGPNGYQIINNQADPPGCQSPLITYAPNTNYPGADPAYPVGVNYRQNFYSSNCDSFNPSNTYYYSITWAARYRVYGPCDKYCQEFDYGPLGAPDGWIGVQYPALLAHQYQDVYLPGYSTPPYAPTTLNYQIDNYNYGPICGVCPDEFP
jgi:hypothetical protein